MMGLNFHGTWEFIRIHSIHDSSTPGRRLISTLMAPAGRFDWTSHDGITIGL